MSGEKNTKTVPVRDLTVKKGFQLSKFLVSWEMVLVYILILINIVLVVEKANLYFSPGTIQAIIQSGMDVSPLVLGMIFILMLGDIDVSVASTMIFSSMVTGLCCSAGVPAIIAVFAGILAGALCGAFNGFCVAYIGMPAVIVTIATSMLFRGIVKIVLDVNVLKEFPSFYTAIAWVNIAGIPLSLVVFLLMGVVFVFILHKSKFGRKLYVIGNNATCAEYSGIDVRKTKMIVFILMGAMCGVASIFFVGRMGGSVSSTMGTGYEMTAIAICVLGGVSTNGGKGKVYGPVIATLIMAFLTYTLGLLEVDANTRKIVTGFILIIAVLIPNVNRQLIANIKLKVLYKNNKNVEALNIKTAEEIKSLKKTIAEAKKDASLNESDKTAKIKKSEDKIASLQKKCKEQSTIWLQEQKEDEKKAKERFAVK
jgi:rhamnose transport system permease protein